MPILGLICVIFIAVYFKPIHELKAEELNDLVATKTDENSKKKSEDIY